MVLLVCAAWCKAPSSHVTWVVVVVVMVAVVRVCDLQTGLPLRLLAIIGVCFGAAGRSLLKEVRHEAHLQVRGGGF